jgi:hypothetical protein
MKAFSKVTKHSVMFVTAIACLIAAGSVSAFAVPASQVARVMTGQTITAQCCVPFGPTVRVTEPAVVAPVIVTWSSDYIVAGTVQFGLSLNGGPCLFYGASVAPSLTFGPGSNSPFNSSTFQWVVFPGDGLVQGSNSFTVCGGGASAPVKIDLGFRTLTVQISK